MRKQTVEMVASVLGLPHAKMRPVSDGGRARWRLFQKTEAGSCQKVKMGTRQESKMATCDDYTPPRVKTGGVGKMRNLIHGIILLRDT